MILTTKPRRLATLVLTTVLALALLPDLAAADTRSVTCPGRSVQNALRLPAGRQLTVRIFGVCRENVRIDRDDVTLVAGAAGATIEGTDPARSTILIEGAKDVVIDGLIVRGLRHGVLGRNGAVFTVQNAIVENNAQNGVIAQFNSTVTVNASQIRNNGQTGEIVQGRVGVLITDSSAGVVTNSTVSGNASVGISAQSGSSVRVGAAPGNVAGPNTISGNGSSGVSIFQTAHGLVHGNTIRDNAGSGVYVEGGSATIVLNAIESNDGDGIAVTNDGGARIGFDIFTAAPRRPDDPCNCTNKIVGNGSDGIEISNGANANFHGNLIEGNNNRGVLVSTATGNAAGGNVIRNNGDDGVGVFRSQFVQGAFSGLVPSRDIITGNGTAHRSDPTTGYGVIAFGASTVNLNNFEVSGSFRDGVIAFAGASAILRSADPNSVSVIENNGTLASIHQLGTGPAPYSSIGSGVNAFDGGSVEVRGVTVRNNKVDGVVVGTRSSASIRAHVTTIGDVVHTIPVTISGNARHGVSVFNGSAVDVSNNATITNNGTAGTTAGFPVGNGIVIGTNSSASVSNSSVTFNQADGISLFANSSLSLGASSPDFPPTGSITLGSFVTDNGRDGIVVSSNSVANLFAGGAPLAGSAVTSVTRNARNGLGCFSQSRVFGNLTGVTGNAVSGSGADLSGSVLVTTTVFDSTSVTTKTVLTPTPLTTSGGSCF